MLVLTSCKFPIIKNNKTMINWKKSLVLGELRYLRSENSPTNKINKKVVFVTILKKGIKKITAKRTIKPPIRGICNDEVNFWWLLPEKFNNSFFLKKYTLNKKLKQNIVKKLTIYKFIKSFF